MIDICSRYIVGAHVVRALLLFLLAGLSAWWAFVAAYPRPAASYQGPSPPAAGTALLQPRLSFGLASGAGERLERPRMQWLNLGCGVAGDHCPATLPGGPRCPAVADDDLGGEVPWLMVAMRVRPQ